MAHFDNLPRSTTRVGYQSVRQHKRDCEPNREERGLAPHPANALIDCPACEGTGERTCNDSRINDPQCEYGVTCSECSGSGNLVDGQVDVLQQLRTERRARNWRYTAFRMRATRPCSGIKAMEMRAKAQACVNEMERAHAAWQQVAA